MVSSSLELERIRLANVLFKHFHKLVGSEALDEAQQEVVRSRVTEEEAALEALASLPQTTAPAPLLAGLSSARVASGRRHSGQTERPRTIAIRHLRHRDHEIGRARRKQSLTKP